MLGLVKQNLKNIKNGNENAKYEIYADFSEFPNLVQIGTTMQERLQILIMCYYVNPTLKELQTLDLETVISYIQETDEYWENDKKYIQKCIDLITEKKEK